MWSVCWDSGEGQLGLTRGGPVSPNCHREHGQRGSVSTVINHTPSPSLPLYSFSRTFPLPLFYLHRFLFFPAVSHFARFSVKPCFPSLFLYSSAPPTFPQMSSFPLGPPILLRLQSPSSPPSPQFCTRSPSQRAVFPVPPSFIRFTSTFLLVARALNMKVSLSRPLD